MTSNTLLPPSALDKQHVFPLVRPFRCSAASFVIPPSVSAKPWVSMHHLLCRQCVQQLNTTRNTVLTNFLPELLPVLLVRLHFQPDVEQLSGQIWSWIYLRSFSTGCSQTYVWKKQKLFICSHGSAQSEPIVLYYLELRECSYHTWINEWALFRISKTWAAGPPLKKKSRHYNSGQVV